MLAWWGGFFGSFLLNSQNRRIEPGEQAGANEGPAICASSGAAQGQQARVVQKRLVLSTHVPRLAHGSV
ncbi:MAG: hypothetical protein SGPRY_013614 [Prymnesium sp.]